MGIKEYFEEKVIKSLEEAEILSTKPAKEPVKVKLFRALRELEKFFNKLLPAEVKNVRFLLIEVDEMYKTGNIKQAKIKNAIKLAKLIKLEELAGARMM